MKKWVATTITLYALCLILVIVPLCLAVAPEGDRRGLLNYSPIFVLVLTFAQAVLVLVPADIARERPVRRRSIVVSAIVSALFMGILTMGFLFAATVMIWGEDYANGLNVALIAIPGVSWILWALVFFRTFTANDPMSFVSSVSRWLLRGSILEVLIAVPSHIVSRHRGDCCAPVITLVGIATGVAVAFLSFGPGLLFLFAKRIKEKRRAVAR